MITASSRADVVEVTITDRGHGFPPPPRRRGIARPRAATDRLAVGRLPDQRPRGSGNETRSSSPSPTTRTTRSRRERREPRRGAGNGDRPRSDRPARSARVIGALAARAKFSVERLSDTVLLGDAVLGSLAGGFLAREVSDRDPGRRGDARRPGRPPHRRRRRAPPRRDGRSPGEGSLRAWLSRWRSREGTTDDGETGEYLVIEVAE